MSGGPSLNSVIRPNRERADSAIAGIEDGKQAGIGIHGSNSLELMLRRLRKIPNDEITEYQRDVTDSLDTTLEALTTKSLVAIDNSAVIDLLWAKLSERPGFSDQRADDPFIQAAEQNLLYTPNLNHMNDPIAEDDIAENWFNDMNDKIMIRDEERRSSGQFEDRKIPRDHDELVESLRYSPEEKNLEVNIKKWKENYNSKVQTGQISDTDAWKVGLSQEMIDCRIKERAEMNNKGFEVAIQSQIAMDVNLAKQKLENGARDTVEHPRNKSSEELGGKLGNPKKERNILRKLSSFTKK